MDKKETREKCCQMESVIQNIFKIPNNWINGFIRLVSLEGTWYQHRATDLFIPMEQGYLDKLFRTEQRPERSSIRINAGMIAWDYLKEEEALKILPSLPTSNMPKAFGTAGLGERCRGKRIFLQDGSVYDDGLKRVRFLQRNEEGTILQVYHLEDRYSRKDTISWNYDIYLWAKLGVIPSVLYTVKDCWNTMQFLISNFHYIDFGDFIGMEEKKETPAKAISSEMPIKSGIATKSVTSARFGTSMKTETKVKSEMPTGLVGSQKAGMKISSETPAQSQIKQEEKTISFKPELERKSETLIKLEPEVKLNEQIKSQIDQKVLIESEPQENLEVQKESKFEEEVKLEEAKLQVEPEDFSQAEQESKEEVIKEVESKLQTSSELLIEPEEEITQKILEEATKEVTPEVLEEVTKEATPEVLEEVTKEAIPEVLEEVTKEVTPEVLEEVTKEAIPEVLEEVTKEAIPEVLEEVTKEAISEVLEEVTKEAISEVLEEVTKEATPEILEEVTKEVTPEILEEVTKEVTPEVLEEVTKEATPEVLEEVTKEATPEVLEEVTKEVTPEILEEATKEVTPEVLEEVTKEANPEVLEEVTKEATLEILEKVTKEANPEVLEEVTKEVNQEVLEEVTIEEKPEILEEVIIEMKPEVNLEKQKEQKLQQNQDSIGSKEKQESLPESEEKPEISVELQPQIMQDISKKSELELNSKNQIKSETQMKSNVFAETIKSENLTGLKGFIKQNTSAIQNNFDKLENSRIQNNFMQQEQYDKAKEIAVVQKEEEVNEDMDKIQELLDCDKNRCRLEPYDKDILYDIIRGHWELFEGKVNEEFKENLEESVDNIPMQTEEIEIEKKQDLKGLIARDPKLDIRQGIVGIDFGTKSTVVVRQDATNRIIPIRIGTGNLSNEVKEEDFENPTIIEFTDVKQFLEDYQKEAGRPHTSCNDIFVSYDAYEDFQNCKPDDFYAFFSELKQWANREKGNIVIKDKQRKEYFLGENMEISEKVVNPIELYAYYIGLYINNMRNGIYLKYLMTFPVGYTKEIRDFIAESFYKGIKKSLPSSILNDKECMDQFKVELGISEPAAYAVTALEQSGLEPKDETEQFMYGIFDFGGGTTDFDFGIWRGATEEEYEKEAYDYVLECFGADSDVTLGGENILELMAYQVYQKNLELFREKKITFTLPIGEHGFAGSETLLLNSQIAKRNMAILKEELRPLWHQKQGWRKKYQLDNESQNEDKEGIIVSLYNIDGEPVPQCILEFSSQDLLDLIKNRIQKGIDSFFQCLTKMFLYREEAQEEGNTIYIFLAGNASKSIFVKELFQKKIEEHYSKSLKMMNGIGHSRFELIDPLTGEGNNRSLYTPNAKTGVAYGLLKSRDGSSIKIVKNYETDALQQSRFHYYLGRDHRRHFDCKFSPADVEYGRWVLFQGATRKVVRIYYTNNPMADSRIEQMPIDNVPYKELHIEAKEDAYLFIRTIEPDLMEYAVAKDVEEISDSEIKKCYFN